MNVYDAVRARLTVRTFKPDPIPGEVVAKLLEAGRLAPSSRNLQPWHFILITDRELLGEIGKIALSGRFVGGAPMAIAIAMDSADRPTLTLAGLCSRSSLSRGRKALARVSSGLRRKIRIPG